MDEKKSAPAEIETVTITMSRPVAEAVAKACEMYLRLHLGQFEDLIDELCMAKFYAALENDSFDGKEERDEMKKLLMGMGLSRNQATRMIQEQRTEGSKDVSNALYFHVFQKNFNLIVSNCGGEVLPYLNSFVLK